MSMHRDGFPKVDLASMSPAHMLASINAGFILADSSDPAVAQFDSLLDSFCRHYPDTTRSRAADILVHTWEQIESQNQMSLIC